MKQTFAKFFALANLILLPAAAFADDMMVMGATASPSHVKAARTASVNMMIMNHGSKPDKLVGIKTDIADSAELHETQNTEGVFRMRPIEALEIAAGATVDISKTMHIMLFGLNKELKKDDGFQMTLDFESAPDVVVNVVVGAEGHLDHVE